MMQLEEEFNLTNKRKHPTNPNKTVYRFVDRKQAATFLSLLEEHGVPYEHQVDEEHERKPMYVGVAAKDERRCDRLNYTAIGRHRSRFIQEPLIGWMIILVTLALIGLAIMGAVISG